jgi:cobalt-zinc-cadmium efflux system outer membrane protein
MTKHAILFATALVLATGCALGPQKGGSLAGRAVVPAPLVRLPEVTAPSEPEQAAHAGAVELAAYEEPAPAEQDQDAEEVRSPRPVQVYGEGLTIETLEQLALANNPVLGQAAARVRALQGKYWQVGLKPNPTIGYMAGEMGNNGTAGQQGGFAGQQFITAGKLQKNRDVVRAEIEKAEQVLAATRLRVRTDIRLSYYRALVAQQRVELAVSLVEAAGEAVQASEDLIAAEEIPRAALLQTEVEQQNAEIALLTAENELIAVWQQMSAIAGEIDLPRQPLVGDPTILPSDLSWDEALSRLTTRSPEIATAMAELSRSRQALNRACVEAVPDVNGQLSVQYDDSTSDTIASVQVGIPLPLWNRNQGGIRQAQAEVSVASQNIDRVALDLKNRLAVAYQDYSNAQVGVETYSTEILPRAAETFDLVRRGYAAGEVGYLELLTAQRTYAVTNLKYLDALDSLWRNWTRIDGLLLDGSLTNTL